MTDGGRPRRQFDRELGRRHRARLAAAISAARSARPADRLLAAARCRAGGRPGLPPSPPATPIDLWHVLLFFIGAFAMRGAGCTWNDIVDRDLDARVERTRSRPIPSGQVRSVQAAASSLVQALIGLAVLLQFNRSRAMSASPRSRSSRSIPS